MFAGSGFRGTLLNVKERSKRLEELFEQDHVVRRCSTELSEQAKVNYILPLLLQSSPISYRVESKEAYWMMSCFALVSKLFCCVF